MEITGNPWKPSSVCCRGCLAAFDSPKKHLTLGHYFGFAELQKLQTIGKQFQKTRKTPHPTPSVCFPCRHFTIRATENQQQP